MKYAINGDTKITKTHNFDVVIVGAGLAGLYTALNIDTKLSVCVLAKESIDLSNSWLAQGGIAAAVGGDDTPSFHLEDTLLAGAGHCDEDAARILVDEGPSDINKLIELNVPFDLNEYGDLQITREGGHRKSRVIHAGGDATGRETVKALSHIASTRGNITFFGHTCLFDVLLDLEGAVSAIAVRSFDSEFHLINTRYVVIATGGIGQVYKHSTNPSVATGDGIAAAKRAGALLSNMEFIQFHPTGLWSQELQDREFLISEAVRGEGGILVNSEGIRFMDGYHELGELAPRDIVARAIVSELRRSGEDHVFIDISSKSEEYLSRRFPTIYNECKKRGINISRDRIPVCPVQHYLMGGIETDLYGRTNVPGLYATGEAANTGVHGANRLASNSMLECLVFGRRAAKDINNNPFTANSTNLFSLNDLPIRPSIPLDCESLRLEVNNLMNAHGNVVRTKRGLKTALERVHEILESLESVYLGNNEYLQTLNITTVASVILESALLRTESIGSHYLEE